MLRRQVAHRFKQRHARRIGGVLPALDPATVLTAWLQNTATSDGIASLADQLNVNPAVQATGSKQPTAQADRAISWDGGDVLALPLAAQNLGTTALGLALWLRSPSSGATRQIAYPRNSSGGSSAHVFRFEIRTDGRLEFWIFLDDANARRGNVSASADAIPNNVNTFVTAEIDLLAATDASKLIITQNCRVVPLSFSVGSGVAPAFPASLVQATGNMFLGGSTNTPLAPFTGVWGDSVGFRSTKMAGAQLGVWTNDARVGLMRAFPAPA